MEKKIIIKLPSGTWLRITGKLKRVVKVSGKSKKRRQAVSYTLIGESLDRPPRMSSEPVDVFYVSSGSITKYILRILDEDIKGTIIIEPLNPSVYTVKIYKDKITASRIKKIAEEMKIVRHPRKTKTSKAS